MKKMIYKKSEEHRRKISKALMGKKKSEKTKQRMSESQKGRKFSEEHKYKIKMALKGKIRGKRDIKAIKAGVATRKRNGSYFVSEETKKKISESQKGKTHTDLAKKRMQKAAKKRAFKQWQNPTYRESRLKALFAGREKRPTKPERRLRNRLNHLFPGEYKYIGDGSVFIGFKNPDFININGQKKVIEIFGNYWHSKKVTGISEKKHSQNRIKHFAKYGYQTLIVWEKELKNIKQLRKKLIEFQHNSKKEKI